MSTDSQLRPPLPPARRASDFTPRTTLQQLQSHLGQLDATAHYDGGGHARETEYRWPCGCRASSTSPTATVRFRPCREHERRIGVRPN